MNEPLLRTALLYFIAAAIVLILGCQWFHRNTPMVIIHLAIAIHCEIMAILRLVQSWQAKAGRR